MTKTLAQQFLEILKQGIQKENYDVAENFLQKHSINGYIHFFSSRKCGWVCGNAIFIDGSVFGVSWVSPASLMTTGSNDDIKKCCEYSDRFTTKFH